MALSDDLALFADNTSGDISPADLRAGFQSIYDSLDDADDYSGLRTTIGGQIAALAAKSVLVAADVVLMEDSADTNAKKKATVTALLDVVERLVFADAALWQTTAGLDGSAAPLRAQPDKYLLVKDENGTQYAIPAFART